jgi:hypothetical protein
VADLERHKRLSADERDSLGKELEKAYTAGRSLAELGQEHGTSAGRVRLILLERGVTLRSRGGAVRKPDPERGKRAEALAKEYSAGASLQELAATHGISATTARSLVQAGGGTLRARGGRRAASTGS